MAKGWVKNMFCQILPLHCDLVIRWKLSSTTKFNLKQCLIIPKSHSKKAKMDGLLGIRDKLSYAKNL